ncbi:hypothetical protein BOTBODRAFT_149069 [Botryobasidium botryosum FD-172 SS1]|uniref:DNA polymerase n=1 Tax=Botryobasidium botryosum (strain FD-172 SS1) TaxID=930990 RepID=A0A067LZ83_BOTB1|nr:hypothetical protein BOTBODRAFT_149069 [Botryobasidium botryosum FD-172 SS1]
MTTPSIKVHITHIDHAVVRRPSRDIRNPCPAWDKIRLDTAPVIRIFGDTTLGQKACVHIHQVYPYFYVEYKESMEPSYVSGYIKRLKYSLNHAIALSLRRNTMGEKYPQYIREIILTKGIHFYGFHHSYKPFLKILLTDPGVMNRAVTILQAGSVMKTLFRTFESHLSFPLQFMCDFGLYGCGWLEIGEAWVRGDADAIDSSVFHVSPESKVSRLPLELDVPAHQILNRRLLIPRDIHHMLSIPANPLPPEPLIQSVRELWDDERARRTKLGLNPTPALPADEPRDAGAGYGWRSEERYWEELNARMAMESKQGHWVDKGPGGWERWVMTVFESVEALWETKYKSYQPWWEGKAGLQTPSDDASGVPVASKAQSSGRTDGDPSSDADSDTEDAFASRNPFAATQAVFALAAKAQVPEAEGVQGNVDVDEEFVGSQRMVDILEGIESDDYDEEWGEPVQGNNTPRRSRTVGHVGGSDRGLDEQDEYQLEDTSSPFTSPKSARQTPRRGKATPFRTPKRQRTAPRTPASKLSSFWYPGSSNSTPRANARRTPTTPATVTRKRKRFVREDDEREDLVDRSPTRKGAFRNSKRKEDPLVLPRLSTDDTTLAKSRTRSRCSLSPPTSPSSDPVVVTPPLNQQLLGTRSPRTKSRRMSSLLEEGASAEDGLFSSGEQFIHQNTFDWSSSGNCLGLGVDLAVRSGDRTKRRKIEGNTFPRNDTAPWVDPHTQAHSSSYTDSLDFAGTTFTYRFQPPSVSDLLSSLDAYDIPSRVYRDPFYSNIRDAPDRPREYMGRTFLLKGGTGIGSLEEWQKPGDKQPRRKSTDRTPLVAKGVSGWEYASNPPSASEVRQWLAQTRIEGLARRFARKGQLSQIEGPTPPNPYGFKLTPNVTSETATREQQNITVLSLEVFARSKDDYLPDPERDEDTLMAVFWCFRPEDIDEAHGNMPRSGYRSGVVVVACGSLAEKRIGDLKVSVVETELDLINHTIDLVNELDPDVLSGWEIQSASWGYIAERAKQYSMDLGDQISRVIVSSRRGGNDNWGLTHTSTFKVAGRHVLNVWRIMRAEQALTSYTFENVAFHLMHRRVPRYSNRTLLEWFVSPIAGHTARVLRYFLDRAVMVIEMIDEAEVIVKNAEFARVFGIDFFSVLSRGSQFKVESFMFRIAKPESFLLLSPSKQDVGKQNAAECIPLIMEPRSQFYKSPLVVLDFQSLYPSIMIAYNYCYSTCLGRVGLFKGQNKFGVTTLDPELGLLEKLKDHITVAPNGMVYVKPSVRKGLLAKMLTELLDTRVMVKQAMKTAKGNKGLLKLLNARQLSLKFICNVTYGYTGASFSGRMPAVEIADSIVESGRETLEKAIHLIDNTAKWGAKVVYGDTDSLFVSLPGKTKDEAFRIGNEMAKAVTARNPEPVKLKFEKVYLPCILMAKKRYVGFKYEHPDDTEPIFDAKGIETIRRDGIPAGQKMVETCIKTLFRSQDLSEVKEYCLSSWSKIYEGRVSTQDFVLAKEVKLGKYSDKVPPPPGAVVAARRLALDARAEPQYGDRVPYVITRGDPKSRLVDRAVGVDEMLWREGDGKKHYYLDAHYYIERQLIPPLARVFDLVGADVRTWYNEMPKNVKADRPESFVILDEQDHQAGGAKAKIDEHFYRRNCIICGAVTITTLCPACQAKPSATIQTLLHRLRRAEQNLSDTQLLCASCTSSAPGEEVRCESFDCSWLFERVKGEREAARLGGIARLVGTL